MRAIDGWMDAGALYKRTQAVIDNIQSASQKHPPCCCDWFIIKLVGPSNMIPSVSNTHFKRRSRIL